MQSVETIPMWLVLSLLPCCGGGPGPRPAWTTVETFACRPDTQPDLQCYRRSVWIYLDSPLPAESAQCDMNCHGRDVLFVTYVSESGDPTDAYLADCETYCGYPGLPFCGAARLYHGTSETEKSLPCWNMRFSIDESEGKFRIGFPGRTPSAAGRILEGTFIAKPLQSCATLTCP